MSILTLLLLCIEIAFIFLFVLIPVAILLFCQKKGISIIQFIRVIFSIIYNIFETDYGYKNFVLNLSNHNNSQKEKIEKQIKFQNRPVRIVYLVNQRAKWNYQSIFEELKKDHSFSVLLVVEASEVTESGVLSEAAREKENTKNIAFFKLIDPDAVDFTETALQDNIRHLIQMKPDIVFYQQPWGRLKYYPEKLHGIALGVYMHYAFLMIDEPDRLVNIPKFHSYIWLYLAPTEFHQAHFLSTAASKYCETLVCGYPKLDWYAKKLTGGQPGSKTVIWAPHHSFSKSSICFATFDKYYHYICQIVEKHGEINWIFKPHPLLFERLVATHRMTEKQCKTFSTKWQAMPNTRWYDSGDYFPLFSESSLMITDSLSFLAEYLPTGKPVIHLRRKDSASFNELGKDIIAGYYPVYSESEFAGTFEQLILNNEDPLLPKRLEAIPKIRPYEATAGTIVHKYLRDCFFDS